VICRLWCLICPDNFRAARKKTLTEFFSTFTLTRRKEVTIAMAKKKAAAKKTTKKTTKKKK